MFASRRRRRPRLAAGLVAAVSVLALAACSPAAKLDLTDPTPDPSPQGCAIANVRVGESTSTAEENLFKIALTKVGNEALSDGTSEAFTWALHLVTGPDKTGAELEQIEEQLKQVNGQVSDLQAQLSQLSTQAGLDFTALTAQIDNVNFSNRISQLHDDAAQLAAYQNAYNRIVIDSKPGYTLTSDDLAALHNMRAGTDNIPTVIERIVSTMKGTGLGTDGPIIDLWTDMAWKQAHHTGNKADGVYTAAYVKTASAPYNYAGALLSQAMRLYANSMHVKFTFQSQSYDVDAGPNSNVCTYYTKTVEALNDWSTQTSRGTGPIPDGTVVDLRDKDNPRLWSDGPITPDFGYSDWYCGTGYGYCYADEWATLTSSTPPEVVNTRAVRDVKLADDHITSIGGWTDWRLPRVTNNDNDLATLADQNPDQTKVVDLTDWGARYGLALTRYTNVTVVGHGSRNGAAVTMLRPLLVDTSAPGADDKVYDVAVGASYAKSYTVVPRPAQDGRAARVVVVRDFTPETQHGSMPSDDPAPLQDSTAPGRTASRPSARPRFTPGTPVSFTTPSACSPNTYRVPADATALQIEAVGGAGGTGPNPQTEKNVKDGNPSGGGQGGHVTGTVPVVPGSTVYVQVGGNGANGSNGGTGGIGNGGAGGSGGDSRTHAGGGGGLSGISTDSACNRWLVAAGGGGGAGTGLTVGGQVEYGGSGGNAGSPGQAGVTDVCTPGTSFPSGSGGQSTNSCGGTNGADGKPLTGGAGGTGGLPGGGGGAGFWTSGGGGAGGSAVRFAYVGGGGAGGDSYLTDPTVWGFSAATFSTSPAPARVTITPLEGMSVTKVSLKVSSTSLHPKDPLTLTATLSGAPRATGDVTFRSEETGAIGKPAPIRDGMATLVVDHTDLGTGTRHLMASYVGAGPYGPGTSDAVVADIEMLTPNLEIGVTPSKVAYGNKTVITVSAPMDMKGEELQVYDRGRHALGVVMLDARGKGSLTASTLEVGSHSIYASSMSDGRYVAADTPDGIVTVNSF